MMLELKEHLSVLVRAKYASARQTGAVVFAPSQLAVPALNGLKIQLRCCPSLAKKPADTIRAEHSSEPPIDPFEDPSTELLVGSIPSEEAPSHNIVLNKFPIIENHFMLATKTYKQQTQLLEPIDLLRTYQCIEEWPLSKTDDHVRSRLFAFFNSGSHSGASQPHRHIQFLPVEDMKRGLDVTWDPLIDSMREAPRSVPYLFQSLNTLPFIHFAHAVPRPASADTLWSIYIRLYCAAAASVQRFRSKHEERLGLHSTGLPISYNLAIIEGMMIICPRRAEGRMVQRRDGSEVGWVALNGTMLAGTLMVKDEELFQALESDEGLLWEVFEAAGIPAGKGFDDLEEDELDAANFDELRDVSSNL